MKNPTITLHHKTERGFYRAADLVAGWKAAKALIASGKATRATVLAKSPWSHFPTTIGDVLDKLRSMVNDGINAAMGRTGRKLEPDWYFEQLRAARDLNRRVAIHWLPANLKTRFAHRIS